MRRTRATYDSAWEELEASSNPFAAVVMAHLKSLETGRQPSSRLDWKLRIIKGLYRQGRTEEEIRQLFRFIDAVMALPLPLDQRFITELTAFEEEQKMPFMTSVERIGMDRGAKENARENIVTVLEERFGAVPAAMVETLQQINDIRRLKALLRQTVRTTSLEEFQQEL